MLRIATYTPEGPSMLALLKGILIEQNGCLVLKTDGRIVLPVFPQSSISNEGARISFGGRAYQLGDLIELGGGAMPQSGPAPAGLDLSGCTAEQIFLVG